jgi:hypothetical protein
MGAHREQLTTAARPTQHVELVRGAVFPTHTSYQDTGRRQIRNCLTLGKHTELRLKFGAGFAHKNYGRTRHYSCSLFSKASH